MGGSKKPGSRSQVRCSQRKIIVLLLDESSGDPLRGAHVALYDDSADGEEAIILLENYTNGDGLAEFAAAKLDKTVVDKFRVVVKLGKDLKNNENYQWVGSGGFSADENFKGGVTAKKEAVACIFKARKNVVTVVDEFDGEPVEGVRVSIGRSGCEPAEEKITDVNGQVVFTLPSGCDDFYVDVTLTETNETVGYRQVGVEQVEHYKLSHALIEYRVADYCGENLVFKVRKQIAVIGAGVAGLAAAYRLCEEGYSVALVEARGRMGGRAYTSNGLGVPFDEGCHWMHPADTAEHPWLKNHRLLVAEKRISYNLLSDAERACVVYEGDKPSVLAGIALNDIAGRLEFMLEDEHGAESADSILNDYSYNFSKLLKLDVSSKELSLTPEGLINMAAAMIGDLDESTALENFSMLDRNGPAPAEDDEDGGGSDDGDGDGDGDGEGDEGDEVVDDVYGDMKGNNQISQLGYGRLVEDFASWLRATYSDLLEVHLSCPVSQVIHGGMAKQKQVVLNRVDEPICARSVIVTVPTPVIAGKKGHPPSLTFLPDLPDVREACGHLPLGNFKKMLLRFDEGAGDLFKVAKLDRLNQYYTSGSKVRHQLDTLEGLNSAEEVEEGAAHAIEIYPYDEDGKHTWRLIVNEPGEGYVTVIVGGEFADELDELDDVQIKERIRNALVGMLGEVPDFDVAVTKWGKDPYCLGSYSYGIPGKEDVRDVLIDTVVGDHLIVFAGEAVYKNEYATAHGAYTSGERAANTLIAHFASAADE